MWGREEWRRPCHAIAAVTSEPSRQAQLTMRMRALTTIGASRDKVTDGRVWAKQ